MISFSPCKKPYVVVMHAFSPAQAQPVLQALVEAHQTVYLMLAHPPTQQHQAWLDAHGVRILYVFSSYGQKQYKDAIINSIPRKIQSLFAFSIFVLWKKIFSYQFIVFEGGYPFSYAACIFARFHLVNTTYVAHGIHHIKTKFACTRNILFEKLSTKDFAKYADKFHHVQPLYSCFINSVYLFQNIRALQKTIAAHQDSHPATKQALFLGGFEDADMAPAVIQKILNFLADIGKKMQEKHPDIQLVYRVHPAHDPHVYEPTQKILVPCHWAFSIQKPLAQDFLSARCAFSFFSSGIYEARDIGLPTLRIDMPEINEDILEYSLEEQSIPFLNTTDAVVDWIYKATQQEPCFDDDSILEKRQQELLSTLKFSLVAC